MSDRPTIHELEEILARDDGQKVTLNPDGSVTVGDTWKNRAENYEKALRFYAHHDSWMAETEADDLRRTLVAMTGSGVQHGWVVAEQALAQSSQKQ